MMRNQQLSNDMLKGTLDIMTLRTLAAGNAHGHTFAKVIERTSEDVLEGKQGSRKAKYYHLTPARRRQVTLEAGRWRRMARAIALVLGGKR
jgi:PadR family transcriptional regulator